MVVAGGRTGGLPWPPWSLSLLRGRPLHRITGCSCFAAPPDLLPTLVLLLLLSVAGCPLWAVLRWVLTPLHPAPRRTRPPSPGTLALCSASHQVTACQHCGLGCALSFGKAQLDFLLGCSVMSQFRELSPHSLQSPVCSPQVSVAPGGVGNMCPRQ